jgi:hypothetical protein
VARLGSVFWRRVFGGGARAAEESGGGGGGGDRVSWRAKTAAVKVRSSTGRQHGEPALVPNVTILLRIGSSVSRIAVKEVGGAASCWEGREREQDEGEDCLGFFIIVAIHWHSV